MPCARQCWLGRGAQGAHSGAGFVEAFRLCTCTELEHSGGGPKQVAAFRVWDGPGACTPFLVMVGSENVCHSLICGVKMGEDHNICALLQVCPFVSVLAPAAVRSPETSTIPIFTSASQLRSADDFSPRNCSILTSG